MSQYRNSTDLVNRVLAILGVLAAGQATDPEDFALVNIELGSIFSKLAALEICWIPDPANIPGQWFEDLAYIIAGECAPAFGSEADWLITMVAKGLGGPPSPMPMGGGAAAMSLKQMNRGRPTGERLRIEYY